MLIVKLIYAGRNCITTAENYIRYRTFDVSDEKTGDFWPVNKEDVVFVDTEEI